jgi:hypothetical protein
MSVGNALLFIDSNKYLDLYRTDKGKKLLAPLGEQVEYIFVTQQVVAEVQRNKILVAAEFLGQKLKGLKLQTFNVPDHLSGTSAGHGKGILEQMKEIGLKIKQANDEVDALAFGIMEQVSCSEDEVSKALAPIFAKAVAHSPEELQKARDRRELGNPPGKSSNPIGDQLTWEQILSHFKEKKRLWIISRDGDYGTVYGGKGYLNGFLYDDLCKVVSAPEVYLFEDTVEGIRHFVETTGVKAERRLTPEEAEEIEKEEKSLPHLTQPSEEVRRAMAEMAKLSQPGEELRRAMAEMAKLAQPGEELRRAMAEMAKLSQPGEELRRAMAEMAKLSQPGEELRRAMAEMAKLAQPGEELRRAMAEMAKLSQPGEELRRAMAEMAKLAQPGEEPRRAMAALRPPPTNTRQPLNEDQEEVDEHRPTSPPSSQPDA